MPAKTVVFNYASNGVLRVQLQFLYLGVKIKLKRHRRNSICFGFLCLWSICWTELARLIEELTSSSVTEDNRWTSPYCQGTIILNKVGAVLMHLQLELPCTVRGFLSFLGLGGWAKPPVEWNSGAFLWNASPLHLLRRGKLFLNTVQIKRHLFVITKSGGDLLLYLG